jgi:hypothetical protein
LSRHAWISEPYADVARHVFPWAFGVVAALITTVAYLVISGVRWRSMRRMAQAGASLG